MHLFPRKSGLRVLKPLSARFNQFYNVSLKNLMWAISEELKEWFGASPFPPPLLAPSPAGPIPHIPKRGYRATVSLVQDKLLGTGAEGGGKERFEHHQELSKAAKMSIRFLVSDLGSMSFGVQNSGFKCCIPLKLQMFKSNALADRNLSTDNSVISCCCLLFAVGVCRYEPVLCPFGFVTFSCPPQLRVKGSCYTGQMSFSKIHFS